MAFELHPVLAKDCRHVGDFPLSLLLLMNQAAVPWFILVPRRVEISEIHQLLEADRIQLMAESCSLSRALVTAFAAHNLNIASIGNRVPQLHVHHVVRFPTDPAWPEPVWGRLPNKPYTEPALKRVVKFLLGALAADRSFSVSLAHETDIPRTDL